MWFIRTIWLFSVAFILGGCGAPESELLTGHWRAVLSVPGGELPFGLELTREGEQLQAHLINGAERVLVDELDVEGDSVFLALSAFNSTVRARRDGSRMSGTLTLIKRGGKKQLIPFTARHGQNYRFFDGLANQEPELAGRWAVDFHESDGTSEAAVAEFKQQGQVVSGTFLTATGDYRFLAGEIKDSTLHLSCFDGGHAFLFKARLTSSGRLTGDFWSGTHWHQKWDATPDSEAKLPDAFQLTYLKPGYDRLSFSFPDLDRKMVSLDDPRFQNKVVIVQLAGSWCPNCHDETAFLAPFYRKYRPRGLEIVGLMYEHYHDFDRAARQVSRFRKRHKIDYQLLVAGYSNKPDAAKTLPMLNHVLSYPTTIFIDRQGKVRKIHTGFTGPGTGEHYDQLVAEFNAFTDMLLAE